MKRWWCEQMDWFDLRCFTALVAACLFVASIYLRSHKEHTQLEEIRAELAALKEQHGTRTAPGVRLP